MLLVALELGTGREGSGAVDAGERATRMVAIHVFLEHLEGRQTLATEGALDVTVVLELAGTGSLFGQRHCNKAHTN